MAWRPVDHIVGQAGSEQETCGSLRSQIVEDYLRISACQTEGCH
ncbi:hypothetical protein ABIA60_004214 [Pseudomonas frederiksbergensis]